MVGDKMEELSLSATAAGRVSV